MASAFGIGTVLGDNGVTVELFDEQDGVFILREGSNSLIFKIETDSQSDIEVTYDIVPDDPFLVELLDDGHPHLWSDTVNVSSTSGLHGNPKFLTKDSGIVTFTATATWDGGSQTIQHTITIVSATALPSNVMAGQTITVTSPYDPYDFDTKKYVDPLVYIYDEDIYDQISYPEKKDIDDKGFQEAIGYVTMLSGPVFDKDAITWTWTYRALRPGKVVFLVDEAGAPFTFYPTNPVTIEQKSSLPMHSILRILGIAGLMRE